MMLLVALLLAAGPLTDANSDFRALYREAKSRALATAGPVLLVEGDSLVLRDGAAREAVKFLPEEYTKLKEVSHVPLGIFVALHGSNGALSEHTRGALEKLAAEIRPAKDPVLAASLELIERVLKRGAAEPAEIDAFARRMGPLVSANAEKAASMELDALAAQVEKLRPRLGASFQVVVMGAHMARTNEISVQYFQRLLGKDREVIFAESLWDEEKALDLVATHLVDGAASAAFFGDPARLHEDMLAEGARKYLVAHPVK